MRDGAPALLARGRCGHGGLWRRVAAGGDTASDLRAVASRRGWVAASIWRRVVSPLGIAEFGVISDAAAFAEGRPRR